MNLKNQKTAEMINYVMLRLTRETMDDNVTIYVITLVTLIYLPSQWIATLLGMNLFQFDSAGGSLKVSKFLWIYVLTAVPLTALTVFWWQYQVRRQRRARKSAQNSLEQNL